jgi:hypothetical protein
VSDDRHDVGVNDVRHPDRFGSNTWTAGSTINTTNPSLGYKTAIFWCVATPRSAATSTVQFTTSASTRGAGILVNFSGSSGTSATVNDVAATGSSSATGTAVSVGPTATTAGADIVVCCASYAAVGTPTAGSGYTMSTTAQVSSNNGLNHSLVYKIASGAAAAETGR